jgi:hypothetical protein
VQKVNFCVVYGLPNKLYKIQLFERRSSVIRNPSSSKGFPQMFRRPKPRTTRRCVLLSFEYSTERRTEKPRQIPARASQNIGCRARQLSALRRSNLKAAAHSEAQRSPRHPTFSRASGRRLASIRRPLALWARPPGKPRREPPQRWQRGGHALRFAESTEIAAAIQI